MRAWIILINTFISLQTNICAHNIDTKQRLNLVLLFLLLLLLLLRLMLLLLNLCNSLKSRMHWTRHVESTLNFQFFSFYHSTMSLHPFLQLKLAISFLSAPTWANIVYVAVVVVVVVVVAHCFIFILFHALHSIGFAFVCPDAKVFVRICVSVCIFLKLKTRTVERVRATLFTLICKYFYFKL